MQEKTVKIYELLANVDDEFVNKFFDTESEELLDEKIEVLTALANGKTPNEITKYYEVLELYPKDGEIWD